MSTEPSSGSEAQYKAEELAFDLVILDLNLPDIDGVQVAEWLKEHVESSILILSARADLDSRVQGLYAGASDYLSKPFSVQELLARVHVRLRERKQDTENVCYKNIRLHLASQVCYVDDVLVTMPELEFHLLHLLLKHRGRLFSKLDLTKRLYDDSRPSSNTIEVFVYNLRKRLSEAGAKDIIKTVRNRGYLVH